MKLKKLLSSALLSLFSLSILGGIPTSSFAVEVDGYTVNEESPNVGMKVEDFGDGSYLVTIGLKAEEGQTIDQIEGTIKFDPAVFDMEDLKANAADNIATEIFTTSENKLDRLDEGYLTVVGSTDVGFIDPVFSDAIGILVKVKDDNVLPTSSITIEGDSDNIDNSFKLFDTTNGATTNLFSGKLSLEIPNLPAIEATEEEVIPEPVVEKVTPEPVVEKVKKINTGMKENAMVGIIGMFLLFGALYLRKEQIL